MLAETGPEYWHFAYAVGSPYLFSVFLHPNFIIFYPHNFWDFFQSSQKCSLSACQENVFLSFFGQNITFL